ncbi:MAG: hypothetical protein HOV80_00600 [Polyangiaceae bacterium]|nr:hypothetical protein [Polyangiaceae bacterium]
MRASIRSPLVALVSLGVVYALFSFLLYRAEVVPRALLLPIDPKSYYLAQTFFVGPLMALLAFVFSYVIYVVAAPSITVRQSDMFRWFAPAYAWPLLVLFVIPDLVVFLVLGHGSLAKAMRIYAPLAPIVIAVVATRQARIHLEAGKLRAVAAAILALFVQGALGALVLR